MGGLIGRRFNGAGLLLSALQNQIVQPELTYNVNCLPSAYCVDDLSTAEVIFDVKRSQSWLQEPSGWIGHARIPGGDGILRFVRGSVIHALKKIGAPHR